MTGQDLCFRKAAGCTMGALNEEGSWRPETFLRLLQRDGGSLVGVMAVQVLQRGTRGI